jgi:phosphoadenosine phosphosulfate reductase
MSGCHDVAELAWCYGHLDGRKLLEALLAEGPLAGRTALVSSFGAESVVLLHMVAAVDPGTPVIFLDTLKHFGATLAYRDQLVATLGLRDVRSARPDPRHLARYDRDGRLHESDPDSCCDIRKTAPLEQALQGFDAWITGRKRFQGALRAELPVIESDPAADRIKLNPLADWPAGKIEAYRVSHGLPNHPLLAQGYRSIGCAPCTAPTGEGQDPRAGRWLGTGKTECGIHLGGRPA